MKLTRSSAYALTAMACLARHKANSPVPSHALAQEANDIPERFLLKLLLPLVSAGILRSVRGPGGGYRLTRPASQVSVLDVIQAVDGPIRGEVPAVGKGPASAFDRRLRAACNEAAQLTRERLARVSIADLARAR
ncbi:MAG TPA: Rrf2 family transcriptional regulator [Gemmataceae bacterium]|nr:Rrf2 family transcriptional regulator [Gemmataceae bacterium]